MKNMGISFRWGRAPEKVVKITPLMCGLILIALLLPSCTTGVSPEEYAKVNADLATAQAKNETLQKDLSAKEAQFEEQLSAIQDELQMAQSQLATVTDKLDHANAGMELINAILLPFMKGEEPDSTIKQIAFFLEWADQIKAIGDPVLTERFYAMVDEKSDDATERFFVYLLESTAKAATP